MSSWMELGDVLAQSFDAVEVDTGGEYPNAGVLNRGRGLFDKGLLQGAQTAYPRLFRLRAGNVVYSKLFAWEGALTLVPDTFDGFFVSSEFPTFDVRLDLADQGYLRHVLAWEGFVDDLRGKTSGLGQRRQRVNVDQFLSAHVPLPGIDEQRRIAAYLDSVGRVSSGIPTDRDPLRALTEHTWGGEWMPVADVVERVSRPVAVDDDTSYPMLGVRWYGEGLFHRETKRGRDLSATTVYSVEAGDLVYNRLFAWKQSFAIASSPLGYVSNEFPTFRPRPSVRAGFLLGALLGPGFTSAVNDASTGSTPTSRNRLKEEAFLSLRVQVPSREVQVTVEGILDRARRLRALRARRDTMTAALLPSARNEVFSAMR